jgi:hypothetical protein
MAMITRFVAVTGILAASIVGSASAQQPTTSGSNDIVVTGQQYDNKVVCRFEQNVGSRFKSRICHTNKEWDEMREQHMRAAHEMIDRPLIGNCPRDTNC